MKDTVTFLKEQGHSVAEIAMLCPDLATKTRLERLVFSLMAKATALEVQQGLIQPAIVAVSEVAATSRGPTN
jgi:hypothetical protein